MSDGASKRVAVLAYHRIGDHPPDWQSWYYVSENTLYEQLLWLVRNDWQAIDDRTFVRGLAAPETLPDRSALLTFDDGCRSMLTAALPRLSELSLPAVLFVPTDHIGLTTEFDRDREPIERMCSWVDLETLRDHNVSIQSHGASHRWFSTLDLTALASETRRSKDVLEQRLGSPVDLLAYPYSDVGRSAQDTARLLRDAGFVAAFQCGGGLSSWTPPVADTFLIDRLAMGPDTDLDKELMIPVAVTPGSGHSSKDRAEP